MIRAKKCFSRHKHERENNFKKNGSPDICLLILLYNKPLSTLHDGKRGAHFVYSIFALCLCGDNQVCAGDTVCVLITVFVQW